MISQCSSQRTISHLSDWLARKPHLLKCDWSSYRQPNLAAYLPKEVVNLKEFHEFMLTNDVAIACGIRDYHVTYESRFVLYLIQMKKDTGTVAFIEFGMDVYRILMSNAAAIREMIYSQHDKLVIKSEYLWIYVAKGLETQDYFLHIRDTKRSKVSLDTEQLNGIVSFKDKIIYEYKQFQVRRYKWMQEVLSTK